MKAALDSFLVSEQLKYLGTWTKYFQALDTNRDPQFKR